MWLYEKRLIYPVNIKKKDLKMASVIYCQYGGVYLRENEKKSLDEILGSFFDF